MEELSSVDKGDASEAAVLAKLKSMGYTVLSPWGDNARYDLAVDVGGGKVNRMQVKTARITDDGRVVFHTAGNHTNTEGTKIKKYGEDEIDSFVAYIQETSDILYVPVSEAPESSMTFRYEAEQNHPSINWVEDYLIEEKI